MGTMMGFIERKRIKFFGLPFSFTKYTISEDKITMTSGFLNITEDDTLMYKIQECKINQESIRTNLSDWNHYLLYRGILRIRC